MNSSKSDMYEIKDSSKNSTVLIVILIGLFIGSFVLLSSVYVINYYLNQNLITNVYGFERIKNILLIIACVLTFISAILILVIGFKNNEEDYTKYKNYVMISKDELKEYKELIAKYKKEIRHLKSKKSSLVVDKKCKVCYYNKS